MANMKIFLLGKDKILQQDKKHELIIRSIKIYKKNRFITKKIKNSYTYCPSWRLLLYLYIKILVSFPNHLRHHHHFIIHKSERQ